MSNLILMQKIPPLKIRVPIGHKGDRGRYEELLSFENTHYRRDVNFCEFI